MTKYKNLFFHILIFVIIEILFIFLILHEIPEIFFLGIIGIFHLSFFLVILVAGIIRYYLKSYLSRFLATYLPILYHIIGHIYLGVIGIQSHGHEHEHSILFIILSTIIVGIFIFGGEYLIHKKYHCETHHKKIHKNCKD